MQPTEEEIVALEQQHKRCAVVRAKQRENDEPIWTVVLRKPTRAEYKWMIAQLESGAGNETVAEQMVRKLCVWPTDIASLLDEWYGLPLGCQDPIIAMVGAAGKADAK